MLTPKPLERNVFSVTEEEYGRQFSEVSAKFEFAYIEEDSYERMSENKRKTSFAAERRQIA